MLDLKNCHIRIGKNTLLSDFSCCVNDGEVLSIMGPSGCGKSTLLNYLSGTLDNSFTSEGVLELDKRPIQHLTTTKRKVGILYQSPLLFPHMTNLENLLFALPANKEKGHAFRSDIAMGKLHEFGLEDRAHSLPEDLSGGQQARIALLRTLLAEPLYLLLDEPFSKLDPTLRQSVRSFTLEQIQKAQIPTILVTHDLEDAHDMGGKIITLG